MRLRGRFASWFALAALVPIAAAALGTRAVVSKSFRDGFERRRQNAETLARRELDDLEHDLERAVGSQAQPDTAYAGGVLLDLGKYGAALPKETRDRLREEGRPLMNAMAFDVLLLTDGDDVVLDAPHDHDAVGQVDPKRARAARERAGHAFYGNEVVFEGSTLRERFVVEAARTISEAGRRVTVVGGRTVGPHLLEGARQDEAVDARVVSGAGEVLIPPRRTWQPGTAVARLPLAGADGKPVAWLELTVSDAEVVKVLGQVTLLAGLLAGAALVLSVLLGLWVARRMTRDLDELGAGAEAVARGELDHEVPVRTKDEIGAVAQALNTMMVDLKDSKERLVMAERVAAWQEIARRLAHEIKNPLTPIQMSIETLRKTKQKQHPSFDEVFEESTRTVLEEADRLKRIVAEFSEFARMPKPEKRLLDLNELVAGTASLYQGALEVERQLEDGLPKIEADRDTLTQVVLNLLENARDAAGQGGGAARIRVQTQASRAGKAVALVVEDSGPGIAADLKDKIFTPYFTTKHAKGGTGLGLAIVHRIVLDHGGRISVGESTLGGARFVVELPTPGASEADLLASTAARR